MKGIEVYRGKVVDEDEYVQGILIGEDKIFQYTEDGEWSVNCGIGCFSIVPETIAYCGKMDIGDLTVLPRTEEVQEYLKSLPKFYLVACWARYGVVEFPYSGKDVFDEKEGYVPLIWEYDDHNGTSDEYYLRKITDTTTASIWNWYNNKSVAEDVAKKLNEKFDK